MPTTQWYPNVLKSSGAAFIADLARWLINDLVGKTGPAGWTIIEAYSKSAALNKYRTPTGGDESNMDNAAFSAGGDFSWQTNNLATDDWIVLRSGVGLQATQFELYLEYHSTTVMYAALIPLNNFATGSGTAPPTFPATVLRDGANLVAFGLFTTAARYTAIADESTLHVLSDDYVTANWGYVGEVAPCRTAGAPVDDRPFVIKRAWNTEFTYPYAASRWSRLSPVDDATVLGAGGNFGVTCGEVMRDYDTNMLGVYVLWPDMIFFGDAGHIHIMGFLRLVRDVSSWIGVAGETLANKTLMKRGTASRGCCVWDWDGATNYP